MKEYKHTEKLMGSVFTLCVLSNDPKQAQAFLNLGVNKIKSLENLLSEFISNSTTSRINKEATKNWLQINEETFQLIVRCIDISKLSDGAFDITTKALKKLYKFDKSNSQKLPDDHTIASSLESVGYQNIELNKLTNEIRFLHKKTSISFAAIGKGMAADKVIQLWKSLGLTSGYVNASGDIKVMGNNQMGEKWKIAVANPDNINENILSLTLNENAIATSGSFLQHFLWKGSRYSHNINPHSGKPVKGVKSVTVISPSAELSDALATAVNIKGAHEGIHFINQLPRTHAIIFDHKNQIHFSEKLQYEIYDACSPATLV